jgi:hypothetical protein
MPTRAVKAKWLGRSMAPEGPYLAMALSEADYRAALKHMNHPWGADPFPTSGATVMTFEGAGITCLLLVSEEAQEKAEKDPIGFAALLAHEAYHIAETWLRYELREKVPASEQVAYAVQFTLQRLLHEYHRRKFR